MRKSKDDMEEKLADLIRRAREAKKWLNSEQVKTRLDPLDYLNEKYNLNTWFMADHEGARVYMTADKLTGLKDESLATLLDSLVHSNPTSEQTNDYPGSFSREYRFTWATTTKDGDYFSLVAVVTARFKEDSETCKRVVVGYAEPSKEPTPIYELQCSDEEAV